MSYKELTIYYLVVFVAYMLLGEYVAPITDYSANYLTEYGKWGELILRYLISYILIALVIVFFVVILKWMSKKTRKNNMLWVFEQALVPTIIFLAISIYF